MSKPELEVIPWVACLPDQACDMTDSIAIVEYGSHTFRAGLAYIFPSDQEPRLVSNALAACVVKCDHPSTDMMFVYSTCTLLFGMAGHTR